MTGELWEVMCCMLVLEIVVYKYIKVHRHRMTLTIPAITITYRNDWNTWFFRILSNFLKHPIKHNWKYSQMLLQWVQTGELAWFKPVTLKEIPSYANLFAEILYKSKSQTLKFMAR